MLWSVHEQLKLSAPITIAWRVSVTFIFHVLLFAKTVITALGSDEQSTVTSFPFRNFGVAILCVGAGIGLPDGESSPGGWAFASCPAVGRSRHARRSRGRARHHFVVLWTARAEL